MQESLLMRTVDARDVADLSTSIVRTDITCLQAEIVGMKLSKSSAFSAIVVQAHKT